MLGAIGSWIKETVLNDHGTDTSLHNPLTALMDGQSEDPGPQPDNEELALNMGNMFSSSSSSGGGGGGEDSESDYDEDYYDEDAENNSYDEEDVENVQYHASPEEARIAFVQEYTTYVEVRIGHHPVYDTDLLCNTVRRDYTILIPHDHPLANMLLQDNEKHPEDDEFKPYDVYDMGEDGEMLAFSWESVKIALSSVKEMFQLRLVDTGIIPSPEKEKEEQYPDSSINEPLV